MPRPRVLVVEDDKTVRMLLDITLSLTDCTVVHAGDVRTAIDRATEAPADVVILDVQLPDGSGVEVCRAIKNNPQTRNTKVVFLTAHRDQEPQAWAAGGDAFLTKPFSPMHLLDMVQATTENY